MISVFKKSQTLGFMIVGLMVLLPACAHRKVYQVASHTVTVSRHDFHQKFINYKETFDYEGSTLTGNTFKVTIAGDRVKVDGVDYGMLRPGDSLLIGDEGVAVNALDYGESEKYLRANNSATETAVRN